MIAPFARWVRRVLVVLALVSVASAAWFLLATLHRSLGPSPVEVEQFWEASRLRRGLPLYVDPLVGAFEDGAPPTRKLVLYTPVWPAILALLPESFAVVVVRLLVGFGWLLGLPALAYAAHRRCASSGSWRRPSFAVLAAIFIASFCLLSRSAWCAAADAPAALLVGVALVRTISRDRMDPLSAALFAAAPFLKPNVCMISLSCFAVEIVRARHRIRETLPSVLAAAAAGGANLLFCHLKSHGMWLVHLRMSTVQPFLWVKWHEWLQDYFVFLGLPHLLVFVGAVVFAVRAPRHLRGSVYAYAAAGATLLWSAWLMGKAGAGTHYYLEPTVAAIVLLAHLPEEAITKAHDVVSLTFAIASLIVGIPLYRTWIADARTFDAAVPRVRDLCALGPNETALSSNVRMEWALTHRVVIPEYQTTYLTHAGKFPLELWTSTLTDPHVRCFALEGALPAEPPAPIPGRESPSVWYVEAQSALRAHFRVAGEAGNYTIFVRK